MFDSRKLRGMANAIVRNEIFLREELAKGSRANPDSVGYFRGFAEASRCWLQADILIEIPDTTVKDAQEIAARYIREERENMERERMDRKSGPRVQSRTT